MTGKKCSIVACGLLVTILVLSLISQVVNQHLLSASKNNKKASANGDKPSSKAQGNPVTATNTANACHDNQTKCAHASPHHSSSHFGPLNTHASNAKFIHKPANASGFTIGKNSTLAVPFAKIKKHITTQNLRNMTNVHLPVNAVNSSRIEPGNHTKNDNNTSNKTTKVINASTTVQGTFTLNCQPTHVTLQQGKQGSLNCDVANKTNKTIDLALECSGLNSTGIECHINGQGQTSGKILVNDMSDRSFPVLMVSRSSPPVPVGVYPYTISAECSNTRSDKC